MDLGLKDKIAIITGATSGLGKAICNVLAAEGAKIAFGYRGSSPEKEEIVRGQITQLTHDFDTDVLAIKGDILKKEDIDTLVNNTIDHFGGVDILVNNAAIWPTSYVRNMEKSEWDRTIETNLTAPYLLCQRVVQYWLNADKKGKIINIVSQAAFNGSTSGHAHYAASKAGLVTFGISLAREVAPYGITVNSVAPGMIRTPMSKEALEKRHDEYIARIPLGRIAEPEEVAYSVAFLASNKADYITGATINVTGGMLTR